MCGLAGIVSASILPDLGWRLALLSGGLAHRGPDDAGFLAWRDGEAPALGRDATALSPGRVGLMHRRLSIIDLAPTGWQPMLDDDGRHAIAFNGEIYNYRELRAAPDLAGQDWRGTSDTEVLAALLARRGLGALRDVTGMFAFAWLDLAARELWLIRDPFGIKPLHYACRDGVFAFASELRPLLAIGAARPLANRRALYRYLRHAVTNADGETVFADIREVPPGHILRVPLDRPTDFTLEAFWRALPRPAFHGDAVAELRRLFLHSVELHLRADVPVAATLSGGIDSSGIVAAMRRIGGAGPLPLFTFGAPGAATDESHWARQMAEAVGGDFHLITPGGDDLAGDLDDLIRQQEQPFQTTSIWAQARVFRAVRDAGFKVVLDGQGADELFGGYPVFRAARLLALLRRGAFGPALTLLRAAAPHQRALLMQALGSALPGGLNALLRRVAGRPLLPDWLDAGYFKGVAKPPRVDVDAPPLQHALIEAQTLTSLPMLLRYADRNAMAVSLENRTPYLTTALAEFAASLPDEALIGGDGTMKLVLRQALRGLVPDAILDRRDKIGFATPETDWFARSPALRALVADSAAAPQLPCFTPAMRARLTAIGARQAPFDAVAWRGMNVIRWARLLGVEFGS